ncbi:MAG: heme ABC exporter ATP-binding protein CcmA [Magnetococcales bacterium]|nr:heme ABC exporter ATP-binding protein CcmA [Magnetococcales bacterium]
MEQLCFGYGRSLLLRGVDLSLQQGECLILFGSNGSGKSTLLAILATLLRPRSGLYRLHDLDPQQHGEELRRQLLYLGHYLHLYGHLTALENLLFFAELRTLPVTRQQLLSVLDTVGLGHCIDRSTRFFSAGMRKRLALARVLLFQPALWLLDEPYSALDQAGVEWLNRLLQDYLSQGGMVIMATHDPDRVSQLPSRTMQLQDGLLH